MKKPFEETQKFTQWWLWLTMIATSLGITLLMSYGMYTQLILGKPWGDEPLSDEMLIVVGLVMITVSLLTLTFYFTSSLEVRVDEHTISYRFTPFIRWRTIDKSAIVSYRVMSRGLRGYGIRFGLNGSLTLNVKSNSLLELNLTNNRIIRIGTQQPEQLLAAVHNIKSGDSAY